MIHKRCQGNDGDVYKCFRCGERLCRPVKNDREIMGHYVYDDKLYCIDCWNGQKSYPKE